MPRDEALAETGRLRATAGSNSLHLQRPLRFLTPEEIGMIDEFLSTVESEGEVHLVVQKGRLRFVTRTEDYELASENE